MPVYRIMTALHPKVKLQHVTAAVKDAATYALANGGSFLDVEDRGLRRAWHPMKGRGQAGPQDQARFINMTCFVKPETLNVMEENLRKETNTLRVRTTLVADTPYKMIKKKYEEEESARLQTNFMLLDTMPLGDERDELKRNLMDWVAERKKTRFPGHRFDYSEDDKEEKL